MSNTTLVESFLDMMQRGHGQGDETVLATAIADEFVLHCPDGSVKDRAETAATYASLRQALSDFSLGCDLIIADGDRLAARTTMEGRFDKPLTMAPMGTLAPTGAAVHFETISIYRFAADGVLVEEWAESDNLTLMTQLGIAQSS